MPMSVSEAKTFVLAQIDSAFGPVPSGVDAAPITAQRENLAACIASLVTYIQTNAIVAPGIAVSTSAGSGATSGPGQIE